VAQDLDGNNKLMAVRVTHICGGSGTYILDLPVVITVVVEDSVDGGVVCVIQSSVT